MLAQTVDPLSGWIAVLVQTGALGLLAWILIRGWPTYMDKLDKRQEKQDILNEARLSLIESNFQMRNNALILKFEAADKRSQESEIRHVDLIKSLEESFKVRNAALLVNIEESEKRHVVLIQMLETNFGLRNQLLSETMKSSKLVLDEISDCLKVMKDKQLHFFEETKKE